MTAQTKHVTVYHYGYCPTCESGVPLLDQHHIPYEVVNAGEDVEAARLIEQLTNGIWVTPIIAIDGQYYICPCDAELARVLGLPLEAAR